MRRTAAGVVAVAAALGAADAFVPASLAAAGGSFRVRAAAAPRPSSASTRHVAPAPRAAARVAAAGLRMTSSGDAEGQPGAAGGEVDTARIATYFGATGAEVLLITAAMAAVQAVGAQLPEVAYKVVACIFFAAMSLKSRVFAILDARRPELGTDLGDKVRAVCAPRCERRKTNDKNELMWCLDTDHGGDQAPVVDPARIHLSHRCACMRTHVVCMHTHTHPRPCELMRA